MAAEDCLEAARKALSFFDEGEIKQYAIDVFARAKQFDDLAPRAAINRAMDEINNERAESYFEDAQIKARNTIKFDRLANLIKTEKANLKEIMIRRHKNLNLNIESSQRAARFELYNSFFGKLTPEERNYITDSRNDIDVFRAIDGKKSSDIAKSISSKHEEYITTRNTNLVKSDAMPLDFINKDRHLKAVHDPSKLLSGGRSLIESIKGSVNKDTFSIERAKLVWKSFIKPLLDLKKTFEGTSAVKLDPNSPSADLSDAEIDKILDKIFDDITTNKSDIQTKSTVANNREAMARKKRMFFQWKDQESFMKYNQKYGQQSYLAALMSDMESSSHKIGLASLFGDSPLNTFTDLKDLQHEVAPQSRLFNSIAERYYNQVAGGNSYAVSPSLAAIGSTLRTATGMSRLGSLAIQGMTDIASGISFAKRWGFDYFESYTHYMTGLFNLVKDEDRVEIAKMFKMNCDSHLGYVGRYVDAMNVGSLLNRATTAFFKWTATDSLDKGNKISAMTIIAKKLGTMSKNAWNNLRDDTRLQMSKYGINENEWNHLRKYTKKNGLFTLDNAASLTNDDLKNIRTEDNKNIPLSDLRDDLNNRIFSMFDVASENCYLSPNAFTKAWTSGDSGTIEGELLGFFFQFKKYSISFIDRVLYQGFKDSVGSQAKIGFALNLIASTLPISVISTYMYYLAQGKSAPDWNRMNRSERILYASNLIAPTMSFMNTILNPQNKGSDYLIELLNGATLKTVSNALSGTMQLVDGNSKEALKEWKKAGQGLLPSSSIPVISPFLNQMYGNKAYLEPGQKQIYGA